MAAFCLENLPWKMYNYDSEIHLEAPASYANFFEEKSGEVILNLPSSLFSGFHPDFPAKCEGEEHKITEYEFRRDYWYVTWQLHHKNHILNGQASYIPQSRIKNQWLINNIAKNDNLEKLITQNGLTYIVYHKKLLVDCEDKGDLPFLMNSNICTSVFEDENIVIFSTNETML